MAKQDSPIILTFSIEVFGQKAGDQEFDQEMVTIGKGASAVLQIEDPSLADLHAAVQVGDDGVVTVLDLGSDAGSFLNGAKVNNSAVKDGDELRVGKTSIRIGVKRPVVQAPVVAVNSTAPAPAIEHPEMKEALGDPHQVADVMVGTQRAGGDQTLDLQGPKLLEVAEVWFSHVMNVRHFGPEVKAVYAGDRNASHLPPVAATLMTVFMLSSVGFYAWKHSNLHEPEPYIAGDEQLMKDWESAQQAATAASIDANRAREAETKARLEAEALAANKPLDEYKKEVESKKAEEEAKNKPVDPLADMETKWNEESKKAFDKASAANKDNKPLYEPQFELYEQPDFETIVKTTLLPFAREAAPNGRLDKTWTEILGRWTRKYDILDDVDVARVAEDLIPGTRVVKDGNVLMIVPGMDISKVHLADKAGKAVIIGPTDELTLWVPAEAENSEHEAVFKEIQELLWKQAIAKNASRGMCSAVEHLISFEDGKDRFDYNGQWASCLFENDKLDAARPFIEKALGTVPAGATDPLSKRLSLKVYDMASRIAVRDAFGGDWKISDPVMIVPEKRAVADAATRTWRKFIVDIAHDSASLGAVNEQIYALERKKVQELAAEGVRSALTLCAVVIFLLPAAVGFDFVQKRKSVQDFFVPHDLLPSNHFALVEQAGGVVKVNFTKDSVGWVQKGKQRITTSDLIKSGKVRDSGGVYQYDMADDESFVNDIGKLAFYIHRVHRAKVALPPGGKDIDWMFFGVLLFLLSVGGLFALRMALSDWDPTQETVEIPDRLVELNVQQVEKEKDKSSGNPDAGEGAKAKLEEGKAGKKESKLMKAKGSRVAVNQAQQNKNIAENSGLMAAMRDIDSSVFSGSGLGESVSGAIGGLLGAEGTQYGSGGLGSRGSGWGGGGNAEGIGGLGVRGRGLGGSGSGKGGGYYGQKGSGGPGLGTGDPIIMGALDKSLIDRVVKQHLAEIRYCYEKELSKNPKLFGKLTIKFVIAKDGTVSQASKKMSTMNNPIVEDCVSSRFLRMRFPAPKGGGIVVVSYPFVFNSQGG